MCCVCVHDVCVWVCAHHNVRVDSRRQLCGVSSFLPLLRGFWGPKSGTRLAPQVPLGTESSCWPHNSFLLWFRIKKVWRPRYQGTQVLCAAHHIYDNILYFTSIAFCIFTLHVYVYRCACVCTCGNPIQPAWTSSLLPLDGSQALNWGSVWAILLVLPVFLVCW